ncbi:MULTISPECIES: 5-(carboxyamino)imidazole ribonucleotide synthase [unclassified Pseudoalteromonas]|jgi:5-(carboxyamino)imidazole ribonucleotide synthase|uniref:5-(carboxyamino)imidazole ribonucleotide synthase n=1 Tax=unclassified Pseudoalteromonas TaxID=194690 RepID=UPI00073045BF|nr:MULTISPECIES: 5-(carboxyamino)imidazole ribonucleotide synthase [unclassified Pseudoalteromonas]KTD98202.1 phosphoribosylaminoimidazole carboxylase [Pseudoalteromonas sp. H71]MBW4965708.1 5-(carboxyamino)imidazole ribonucleotide synthase [Pseudoalteromonas sp. CR1]TMN82899.1 5-(carboxyamino)imidazole ribonucleotide synthase [Pseudoalteromonas sp. S410]TMN90287.1 5-(carboxyamino)imidazole ribonucleotide synthase [Pseudoalteromonas sp. S408]TMO00849.1 5-(carboxyamino)imidazole ribonucleotide 
MNILILGAGQLARMMSLAGAPLNLNVVAYDVGSQKIVHPLTGEVYTTTLEQAIESADAITAEFEHIPDDVLTLCCNSNKFYPGKAAIKTGGDRALEKALLNKTGVECAPYQLITEKAHLELAAKNLGKPLVIKTCQAGYDGKGQWRLKSDDQIEQIWSEMADFIASGSQDAPHTIIAEKMIPFDREVSIIGARDKHGNVAIYPLTENEHTNGVLTLSVAGKNNKQVEAQANDAFTKIANELNYVGVLAIEFFDVMGTLLVNEIAPRVHNSGHWTQQGCHCSQFENHMRAVAGLPLGNTELKHITAMINVLGQASIPAEVLTLPDVTSHWYGKAAKPGRKMGHINVSAHNMNDLSDKLSQLTDYLPEHDYPGILKTAEKLILG